MSVEPTLWKQNGGVLVPATKAFDYDAIKSNGRRRRPATRTRHEIAHLGRKRQKATGTVRDQQRNFSLVAWICRMHCQSVARFKPMVRTKSREVNKFVKAIITDDSRPKNFDVARRHSRDRFMMLFEMSKIIDGTGAILKRKGLKAQAVEGDRICKPSSWPSGRPGSKCPNEKRKATNDDGLIIDEKTGAIKEFCICKRDATGQNLEFEAFKPADAFAHDGTFERFDDFRGKSPLLAALNMLVDTKENMEYVNLQIKKAAYYGLAFMSDLPEDIDDEEDEDAAAARVYDPKFEMTDNPIVLNLDDGDKVIELGQHIPNSQIKDYVGDLIIRCAMLCLDIPFSFYDGTGISYSGRIADANRYEESCEEKRESNREILVQLYNDWKVPEWWASDYKGIRTICEKHKVSLDELVVALEWIPSGKQWIDQLNQGKAYALHLAMGLTSTPRIAASFGDDAYDIADEQGEYLAYCKDNNLPIFYAGSGQEAVQRILAEPAPNDESNAPATKPAGSTK